MGHGPICIPAPSLHLLTRHCHGLTNEWLFSLVISCALGEEVMGSNPQASPPRPHVLNGGLYKIYHVIQGL